MKKLYIIMAILLFFVANIYGDRKSYDAVTATNSAYNNYIQDVIGNKSDTTNGASIMGTVKLIKVWATNSGAVIAEIKVVVDTNSNRLSLVQSDGITNEKLLRTNINRVDLIRIVVDTNSNRLSLVQSDGITNEKLLRTNINRVDLIRIVVDTNSNRLSLVQSDGITNEKLLRTNINRVDLIRIVVDTNSNRLSLIQSDGITNEKLLRTNMNRIDQIRVVVDTNSNRLSLIQSDGITNEKLIRTNQNRIDLIRIVVDTNSNRLSLIQSDGITNEKLIRTNQNRIDLIRIVVDTNEVLLRTNRNRIDGIREVCDTNEAQQDVPGVDSVANTHMRDVIGNKTDTWEGDSIYTKVINIEDHIHQQSLMYPTMAVGAIVETSLGVAWTVSNVYTNVIVPVNTITDPFDIHYLSIENISANSVCEIILINMTTGAEIGRVRVTKNAVQDGTMNVPIQTPIQAANSKIGAQMGSDVAATVVTFSIFYHIY